MAGKNTSVLGIYNSYSAVERAVDELEGAGFRNTDISVLFPANVGSKDFAHVKGTKAPEGATTGGGTGAVVGGSARLAGGHRRAGDSRPWPVHRSGADHGCVGRRRGRWRSRRSRPAR